MTLNILIVSMIVKHISVVAVALKLLLSNKLWNLLFTAANCVRNFNTAYQLCEEQHKRIFTKQLIILFLF